MRYSSFIISFVFAILIASQVHAGISGQLLGTAAPGAVIDGVSMTPFGPDPLHLFDFTTSVSSPLGGSVEFSGVPLWHTVVGTLWNTWSHGYTGDLYRQFDPGSVTLTLPANTLAFYLYVEPNDGTQPFSLTATGSGGGNFVLNDDIFWNASAKGFFFKGVGETLTSIQISTGGSEVFAIGEFGIAIPAPGALALLGLAGVIGPRGRRRRA